MIKSAPLLLAGVLLAGGCSTVQFGRDFKIAGFDSGVRIGATSRDEVRKMLGAPVSTGIAIEGGQRLEQWVYYYGDGNLGNMAEARFKLLQVRFDKAGQVASYNWSE